MIVLFKALFKVVKVYICQIFDYLAWLVSMFSNSHTFHYHLICLTKRCPALFTSFYTLGTKYVVVPAQWLVLFTINSFWVQEIHCRISFRRGFCNLQPEKVSVNYIIPQKDHLVFTTRAYFILLAIPIIISNFAYCYSGIFQRQYCSCSWSSFVCLDTACVDIVQ